MEKLAKQLVASRLRTKAVLDLLIDILNYRDQGLLVGDVVLSCEACDEYVVSPIQAVHPIHRCGAVLKIATCHCCQLPATYMREFEDTSLNFYANVPYRVHGAVIPKPVQSSSVSPEVKAILDELDSVIAETIKGAA